MHILSILSERDTSEASMESGAVNSKPKFCQIASHNGNGNKVGKILVSATNENGMKQTKKPYARRIRKPIESMYVCVGDREEDRGRESVSSVCMCFCA